MKIAVALQLAPHSWMQSATAPPEVAVLQRTISAARSHGRFAVTMIRARDRVSNLRPAALWHHRIHQYLLIYWHWWIRQCQSVAEQVKNESLRWCVVIWVRGCSRSMRTWTLRWWKQNLKNFFISAFRIYLNLFFIYYVTFSVEKNVLRF